MKDLDLPVNFVGTSTDDRRHILPQKEVGCLVVLAALLFVTKTEFMLSACLVVTILQLQQFVQQLHVQVFAVQHNAFAACLDCGKRCTKATPRLLPTRPVHFCSAEVLTKCEIHPWLEA